MKSKSTALALLLMLTATPAAILAAGATPPGQTNPEDEAAAAYARGLDHRDRAWGLEKEREEATDPSVREQLAAKAQKEYERAIRAYRAAIEDDPSLYQAYGSLGYALRKTGKYQESLEAYDQALELQPDYAEAIEYRAEAYLGLNRVDDAKEAYMQLFRDDRERADQLMVAMESWVEQRRADAAGVDSESIESFSSWVEERQKIAGNTAWLGAESGRTW